MNEWVKYGMYFILGGTLVSLSTFWGAQGKGFWAALASTLPMISGLTFVLVYLNAGSDHTLTFAKHLIWLSPPWFLYVGFMIFGMQRFGFWLSYVGAMILYLFGVGMIRGFLR